MSRRQPVGKRKHLRTRRRIEANADAFTKRLTGGEDYDDQEMIRLLDRFSRVMDDIRKYAATSLLSVHPHGRASKRVGNFIRRCDRAYVQYFQEEGSPPPVQHSLAVQLAVESGEQINRQWKQFWSQHEQQRQRHRGSSATSSTSVSSEASAKMPSPPGPGAVVPSAADWMAKAPRNTGSKPPRPPASKK